MWTVFTGGQRRTVGTQNVTVGGIPVDVQRGRPRQGEFEGVLGGPAGAVAVVHRPVAGNQDGQAPGQQQGAGHRERQQSPGGRILALFVGNQGPSSWRSGASITILRAKVAPDAPA